MNKKFKRLRTFFALALCLCSLVTRGFSQTGMQDDWKYYGFNIAGSFRGGTVAPDGNLYLCSVTSLKIYSPAGVYLGVRSGFVNLRGCAVSADGTLFVFDMGSASKIIKINKDGQEITRFGMVGTGAGQFSSSVNQLGNSYQFMALDENQNIYAVDPNNYRVNVFTKDGVFLKGIGSNGALPGQFSSLPVSVVIEQGGGVIVATRGGQNQVMRFTKEGTYQRVVNQQYGTTNLSILPDNLIVANFSGGSDRFEFRVVNDGGVVYSFSTGYIDAAGWVSAGIMAAPNGDIWCITGSDVRLFKRKSQLVDLPLVSKFIPQPVVLSLTQRANTALMDIDYRVTDTDSATVTTAALAFRDNGVSLSDIIPLTTLAEGTAANIGPAQTTGQIHRLTWNVGADQTASFVSVNIEVYAKDERGLYPFHWITLPDAIGGSGSLTISARPLTNANLFQLWLWLVATRDSAVELRSDGIVYGTTGAYANLALASGSSTVTASGRAYLLQRLGVRTITAQELARAQAGRYSFESVSANSVVKMP
jgi:hypothetical protein